MRVLLSYRRGDVAGYVARLRDDLAAHLDSTNVVMSVFRVALAPGADVTQEIDRGLDGIDAVLAVMGPGWLMPPADADVPKLLHVGDFVDLEISAALRRGIPVVPVLVGGGRLPAPEDLPRDLIELVRGQSATLRDETWHVDVDVLRLLLGVPRGKAESSTDASTTPARCKEVESE